MSTHWSMQSAIILTLGLLAARPTELRAQDAGGSVREYRSKRRRYSPAISSRQRTVRYARRLQVIFPIPPPSVRPH